MEDFYHIADKLCSDHSLSIEEYESLIKNYSPEAAEYLRKEALALRKKYYGNSVYIRGLIEFTNICKNDCLYCGIRKSNLKCQRYRLSPEEILDSCNQGYELGFRTFVLQGGEDTYFTDDILSSIIMSIKEKHNDCAVTLSIGERSLESYRALHRAGADRYLLRHETADPLHYAKLHPSFMSFTNRMECLKNLREAAFVTGAGFMVGSPFQTPRELAQDLKFIEDFKPQMCGIGPFIPHSDTPFADYKAGSAELTCYLLSIIRIIKPDILLPSTTALSTLSPNGRLNGILSGANVIMPNLSPLSVRKKYSLYNKKACTGSESAQELDLIKKDFAAAGYEIVVDRGDPVS
ncbi:[FeFe] hydrogenase H-cluster radical SAM maturase HydE [Treponema sp.]|uniref:[FeFe] hydrogenase H-cluster radical SAM maturase HydE n=1 Tax=Treponema sp. TaxID=166 RepID=UPI0025DBCE5A|nr:[FeFe] hydrogenase H-cluster radical SAM maturase HydE [Treponema sp.]MCR5217859.1 [FeFe] hydrogenase H-cluster radical SAM maturase HydE [Treponema sp.]